MSGRTHLHEVIAIPVRRRLSGPEIAGVLDYALQTARQLLADCATR